jgi:hypothetical protein
MKKILALALCLVMVVSLAACSGSDKGAAPAGEDKVTDSPSPSEAAAETPDASETPEESREPAESEEPSEAPADDAGAVASGSLGDYEVSIISAEQTEDMDGNPAIYITYEWTNNSDTEVSFLVALSSFVYQNGIECEVAILDDNIAEINDVWTNIQPGTTITVAEAYVLQDTENPIDVEVEEFLTLEDNPPQVAATFEF